MTVLVCYCVRCKQRQSVEDLEQAVTRNGRYLIRGTCSHCQGRVTCFGKLATAAAESQHATHKNNRLLQCPTQTSSLQSQLHSQRTSLPSNSKEEDLTEQQ